MLRDSDFHLMHSLKHSVGADLSAVQRLLDLLFDRLSLHESAIAAAAAKLGKSKRVAKGAKSRKKKGGRGNAQAPARRLRVRADRRAPTRKAPDSDDSDDAYSGNSDELCSDSDADGASAATPRCSAAAPAAPASRTESRPAEAPLQGDTGAHGVADSRAEDGAPETEAQPRQEHVVVRVPMLLVASYAATAMQTVVTHCTHFRTLVPAKER